MSYGNNCFNHCCSRKRFQTQYSAHLNFIALAVIAHLEPVWPLYRQIFCIQPAGTIKNIVSERVHEGDVQSACQFIPNIK